MARHSSRLLDMLDKVAQARAVADARYGSNSSVGDAFSEIAGARDVGGGALAPSATDPTLVDADRYLEGASMTGSLVDPDDPSLWGRAKRAAVTVPVGSAAALYELSKTAPIAAARNTVIDKLFGGRTGALQAFRDEPGKTSKADFGHVLATILGSLEGGTRR
jgi:hypothetical protein